MRDRTASIEIWECLLGNHKMQALVPGNTLFGRTRSRKSITSKPFHPFSEAIADAQHRALLRKTTGSVGRAQHDCSARHVGQEGREK